MPSIISAPFKLLLFIFVDGWEKLIEGLLMSYNYA
jgi:type III secretion protein R